MNTTLAQMNRSRHDIQTARHFLLRQRLSDALEALDRAERALGDLPSFSPQSSEEPQTARNDDRLSARERDVLTHLCRGLSNKHIALSLAIAPETVKAHIKRIFVKLHVCTRAQAVFRANSLGYAPNAIGR